MLTTRPTYLFEFIWDWV